MKKYAMLIIMLLASTNTTAMVITPVSSKDVDSSIAQYLDMETLQGLISQTCYEFSPKGCKETGAFVIKSDSKITSITSQNTQALAVISSPKNDLLTRLSCIRTKPNEETIVAGCPTAITTDASYLWETQSEKEKVEFSNNDVIVIPLNLKKNKRQEKPEETISITVTNENGNESTSTLPSPHPTYDKTIHVELIGKNMSCNTTECGTFTNELVPKYDSSNYLVGFVGNFHLKLKNVLGGAEMKITGNRYLIHENLSQNTSECPDNLNMCAPFIYTLTALYGSEFNGSIEDSEYKDIKCILNECEFLLDLTFLTDGKTPMIQGKYFIANRSTGWSGRPVLHARPKV
jgi:hypothetical protein